MNRRKRVTSGLLAFVGVASLTLAVLVALAPGFVPVGPLAALLAPLVGHPGLVVLAAGGLAALTAHGMLTETGDRERPSVDLPTPPSVRERHREDVDVAGDWVDERLAKVRGDEDVDTRVGLAITKQDVRERVKEVAAEVISDTESCPKRVAYERISKGEWTDRPRARVFLAADDEVDDLPLSVRIADWASGEAFDRRVQATVEELASRAGVDVGASLAPTPAGVDDAGKTADSDWQPDRDFRSTADWTDSEGDQRSGLYREDMFTEDGAIDLDAPGEGPEEAEVELEGDRP